jgi:hypothetical protein
MRLPSRCSLAVLLGVVLGALPVASAGSGEGTAAVSAQALRAHVEYLAGDELGGRGTPSAGLELAAQYIENCFGELNLVPLAQGSYRQPVRLPAEVLQQSGTRWSGRLPGELVNLECPQQAILAAGGVAKEQQVAAQELVFLPEFFDSGFPEDVDLGGRGWVLWQPTESTDQERAPSAASEWRQRARSPRELSRWASRQGAAFVLLVPADGPAGDSYVAQILAASREPRRRSRFRPGRPVLVVRDQGLRESLSELAAKSRVAACPSELSVAPISDTELQLCNVVGMLPGGDPKLSKEYLLLSAHYDHLGTRSGAPGDAIYNGADDNASGTAAVLSLAAAFSKRSVALPRSLVFVAFCAEEVGLVGSEAYVAKPLVPLESTIAVVNLEMIGRPDDIGPGRAWITGFQYSELGEIFAAAGQAVGFEFYRHPQLGDRLFGASDNLPFAKAGIVAHSISAGSLHPDYHKPSDEVQRLDHANMAATVQAVFAGIRELATRPEPPRWKEGARFRR